VCCKTRECGGQCNGIIRRIGRSKIKAREGRETRAAREEGPKEEGEQTVFGSKEGETTRAENV
jgi:hypothetical protein